VQQVLGRRSARAILMADRHRLGAAQENQVRAGTATRPRLVAASRTTRLLDAALHHGRAEDLSRTVNGVSRLFMVSGGWVSGSGLVRFGVKDGVQQ
jgi:hypothetical protein